MPKSRSKKESKYSVPNYVDAELLAEGNPRCEATTIYKDWVFIEPLLKFLYQNWWRVETTNFEQLPDEGAIFIACNTSGQVPWPALMLIYILMTQTKKQRPLYVLADIDLVENERLRAFLSSSTFMPWAYDNAKQLIEKGELIAVCPEDNSVANKSTTARNRLKRFDWTKFLPAIEAQIPIYPLATLGVDEANGLPLPFDLAGLPVSWKMSLLAPVFYEPVKDREAIEEEAKKVALRVEGDIQAEINRMLRARPRIFGL